MDGHDNRPLWIVAIVNPRGGRRRETTVSEQVLTTLEGGVLTITLNRPERMNAVSHALRTQLIDVHDLARFALDDVRERREARARE